MGRNHRGEAGRSSNAQPCRDAPQLPVLPMVVKIARHYNEPRVDKIGKIPQGSRMDFLKTVTGKILTGLIALAVIAAAISWWQMEPATRSMIVSGTGRIVAWTLAVLVLPWATFFVSVRAGKFDSNLAGAALVTTYTLLELVLLAWLFHWRISGAAGWTFVIAGGLLAAVYNLFTCDWIAEKLG
jgi:hypothetical protein